MADQQKEQKDKDAKVHGRDTFGKDDPARTRPYTFNEPREQAEIVAEAYDVETPTPTQMENDQAKVAAMHGGSIPEGGGDPQMAKEAEAKKKKDMEASKSPAGYQTKTVP